METLLYLQEKNLIKFSKEKCRQILASTFENKQKGIPRGGELITVSHEKYLIVSIDMIKISPEMHRIEQKYLTDSIILLTNKTNVNENIK